MQSLPIGLIVGEGSPWESVVVITNLDQELRGSQSRMPAEWSCLKEQNCSCNFVKIRDYAWSGSFCLILFSFGWLTSFPLLFLEKLLQQVHWSELLWANLLWTWPEFSPGCRRCFWFYREQEVFYHPSMHVLLPTTQLPRNESETGNSHLVSGSTLLVEEAKQAKPQGSHKQGFRSSHAEEPAARQHDQPWSQVPLFYDASMMVCRTPQPQKCPLSLWFSSGAIALALWDVCLPAGRTSSMEQAVRQCWTTESWR